MANEHGLFWNSQNGDRVYDANDFSEWLKKFYTTGVFNGDLAVTASGGMTVSVSSGYVNIEGKVKFFSTPTTLTIATAGGTYERIDTVVAECNYSDREITVKVVTGAYSASPKATAPIRTAAAYQLVLAEIDVPAGATEITQKNITDMRTDSSVCGLVTGTVSQIDFSTVKAQFDSWFEDVKGTLDSDAAGNLKNQIDAANEKINTNTNNIATNTSAINTLNERITFALYEGAWVRTSSNGLNQVLTETLVLPAGLYIIFGYAPSGNPNCCIGYNGTIIEKGYITTNFGSVAYIDELTEQTNVALVSTASTSLTYSYIYRAGIKALKIK